MRRRSSADKRQHAASKRVGRAGADYLWVLGAGIGTAAVFAVVVALDDGDRPDHAPAPIQSEASAEVAAAPAEPQPAVAPSEAPDEADTDDGLDEVPAVQPAGVSAPAAVPTIELPECVTELLLEGFERWIAHEMVPGETIDQIAHRYWVHPDHLRQWNRIAAAQETLELGEALRVRPKRYSTPRFRVQYPVQVADTWWSIGTRYGVDSRTLRELNGGPQARLEVGQVLDVWIDPVVYRQIESQPVDPAHADSIRPGAVGVGPPQAGRLINGVKLPALEYYELYQPRWAYGTSHAVEQVIAGMARFRLLTNYDRPVLIGAMSRRHGGPLPGHRSHQSGRDLDIRLPFRAGISNEFAVEARHVDWEAVWNLIVAFSRTSEVTAIFFDYDQQERVAKVAESLGQKAEARRLLQYPRGQTAAWGLVRHSSGHVAHVHVRFTCAAYETECVPSMAGLADD